MAAAAAAAAAAATAATTPTNGKKCLSFIPIHQECSNHSLLLLSENSIWWNSTSAIRNVLVTPASD